MAIAAAMAAPSLAQGVGPELVAASRAAQAASGDILTIPSGTEIWLAPRRDISSRQVRLNDTVAMQVSRDVFVHHILVIPRGTDARGRISYRSGKGVYGKSAKMEFELTDLQVAHRPLSLDGHYRIEGEGNSTATIIVAVLAGLIWPLFITGHSAVVPAGSEWQATTAAPLQIALDSSGSRVGEGGLLAARYTDDRSVPHNPAPAAIRGSSATATGAQVMSTSYRSSPVVLATYDREIPLNSTYTPPPAELFVKSLPPRP